jgi:hypothetical protein
MMSEQRFGRIPDAKRRSGLSRGFLYELAAKHKGLFRKAGVATIVDLEKLDSILAALPPAEISQRKSESAEAGAA